MEHKKIKLMLNVTWKVVLGAAGICAILLVIALVCCQYREHYGKGAHYYDSYIGDNICVHRFSDKVVRLYDTESKKYISPKLLWVARPMDNDSIAVFCNRNGKRGFLNANTGKTVIDARFEHAWVFSEGLAAVVESDGKMGFIDTAGRYVLAPELDYIPSHDYVFKHGVCCIANLNDKEGLLGRNGEWVFPQEYDFINYIEEADMFVPSKDGKDGLVMNGTFEWVYPMEYDRICWTDAPSGKGFIFYKNFEAKHVALDGTVIDDFVVDDTEQMRYMIKYNSDEADEYAISDKVFAFKVCDLWGVMDKATGKVLVPAMYGSVTMASEGVIKCCLDEYDCDDYVLYDLKGRKLE